MDDLDFSGLRADLEASVVPPEFDEVARRARRHRTRGRLATGAAMLCVVGILAPTGFLATRDTGVSPAGSPDATASVAVGPPSTPSALLPTGRDTTPQVSIVAVDGADLDHVYALVDVCLGQSCDLQLTPVSDDAWGTGPVRTGLLRAEPTDWLSGYGLNALSETTLVVSAVTAGGQRAYRRIDLHGEAPSHSARPLTAPPIRIAITSATGALETLDPDSGEYQPLPSQPPLDDIQVVGGIPAAAGLWLTGIDPSSGRVSVATSRDAGRTWTATPLAVIAGVQPPSLASRDGTTAYLLVRANDRTMRLYRTRDGGHSWTRLPVALPWSDDPTAAYGIVMLPDGSLLSWLGTDPTKYARSADDGETFTRVSGPGGPVIAVPDGYVAVSRRPKLSSDGVTWTEAALPYQVDGF